MTAPAITHGRDLILDDDGAVLEDYRFLDYDFAPLRIAAGGRTYFDESNVFAFRTVGIGWDALPDAVCAYLTHRFEEVKALGRDGYRTLWRLP